MPELIGTFVFPLPMNRGNTRGHSRYEFSPKNKFYQQATLMNLMEIVAFKKRHPIHDCRWFWKSHTTVAKVFDADNLVALHKWPLDWMAKVAKVIKNDSPAYFWPLEFPTQKNSKVVQDRGIRIDVYR